MALEYGVYGQIEQPKFIENMRNAEKERASIEQTNIQNARSLNQLEAERIATAKRQRQDEYDKWRNTNIPSINPTTGAYDVYDYISRASKNGFGEFALKDADELQKNLLSNARDQQQVIRGHDTGMEAMAAVVNQSPQNDRQKIADQMADAYVQQFGFDPRKVAGQEWYKAIQQRSQTTENNRLYNNEEGRNPNSQTSKQLRDLLNANGANIPAGVSAFEITTNPTYSKMFDQLSPEVRTQAIKETQQSRATIDRLTNMVGVIDQAFKSGTKPTEFFNKWIDTATNDEERAQRVQIINELDSMGIKLSETDSVQGARNALVRKINEAGGQMQGAKALATSKTIGGAIETQPPQPVTPTSQSGNFTVQVLSTGRTIELTPSQAEQAKSRPDLFKFVGKSPSQPMKKEQPKVQKPANISLTGKDNFNPFEYGAP